jgi:hypothetical protein
VLQLNIHRFKVLARFGLMHIVATNLCVWIRTLVLESIKEISNNDNRKYLSTTTSTTAATTAATTTTTTTMLMPEQHLGQCPFDNSFLVTDQLKSLKFLSIQKVPISLPHCLMLKY